MLKVILGCITGFTMTIWYVALDLKYGFDSALAVNAVIASATVVAAAIHFDSVRKQDRERVWEINKEALLGLSQALSDVISETIDAIDFEHDSCNPETASEVQSPSNPKAYKNLDDKLLYMLNVHKPLLPIKLVNVISELQVLDKEITRQVNFEDLEHLDAYETMFASYKSLQEELNKFIRTIAGVGRT